jgi:hypothetical protein
MTIGYRSVVTHRSPCSVFVGTRINLLWTSQVLGFEPKIVHFHRDSPVVTLVRRLFPSARIVVGSRGALPAYDFPKVAFIHGSVGSFAFLFDQVDVIVTTQGRHARYPRDGNYPKCALHIPEWAESLMGLTIAICGLVWRGVPLWRSLSLPLYHGTSTLSAATRLGGAACAKPPLAHLKTPRVLETRPGMCHGGG